MGFGPSAFSLRLRQRDFLRVRVPCAPAKGNPVVAPRGRNLEQADHGLTKLVGILDLVRPGGRIVDFKTAGQTANQTRQFTCTRSSSPFTAFCIVIPQVRRNRASSCTIWLKTPKLVVVSAPQITEQQKTRLFKHIESYLNGVQRQDWVPSPSPGHAPVASFSINTGTGTNFVFNQAYVSMRPVNLLEPAQ